METIKPQKSLVDQTYEILLNAICTGEFAPGTRLNQDELAARLNVSRQPVNSAISILRTNRLVVDTGRRGVVVAEPDISLFQSIYEFRSVIEPLAVELACTRLPPDAASEAEEILIRGERAVGARDTKALLEADIDFHQMLYRWSGNPVIDTSMQLNWHHIRRSMVEVLKTPLAAVSSWAEHRNIARAVLAGDKAAAAQAMRHHITHANEKITATLADRRNPK